MQDRVHGLLTIAKEDGEILWHGNNNMTGYKGLPAATNATVHPETKYLHTGDIGRVDENGYLYITGRKKEVSDHTISKTFVHQHFII